MKKQRFEMNTEGSMSFHVPEPYIEDFDFRETEHLDRLNNSKSFLGTLSNEKSQTSLTQEYIPNKPNVADQKRWERENIETRILYRKKEDQTKLAHNQQEFSSTQLEHQQKISGMRRSSGSSNNIPQRFLRKEEDVQAQGQHVMQKFKGTEQSIEDMKRWFLS